MKKLLIFLASALSLAIIFGAGMASAAGTTGPQQANAEINETRANDQTGDELPEQEGNSGYGFRFRLPHPPRIRQRPIG